MTVSWCTFSETDWDSFSEMNWSLFDICYSPIFGDILTLSLYAPPVNVLIYNSIHTFIFVPSTILHTSSLTKCSVSVDAVNRDTPKKPVFTLISCVPIVSQPTLTKSHFTSLALTKVSKCVTNLSLFPNKVLL